MRETRQVATTRMLCCAGAWVVLIANPVFARQDSTGLSGTLGINQITDGKVTAAISFLASDELAGRATASPEFNIAAAFVASRFRGAGLTGGALDGSFFHETTKKMIRMPNQNIAITTSDGSPIASYGLLGAMDVSTSYDGQVTPVDLDKEISTDGLTGVVAGLFPMDSRGQRSLAKIVRMTKLLKDAGATALLLGVSDDSELIQLAHQAREKAVLEPKNRYAIPVLLVPNTVTKTPTAKFEIPATVTSELPMRNVIGMIQGTDPELSKEAILFSAHLDHLGSKEDAVDGIYNGADDDATGVTAVILLADAFSAIPKPKRTILFMTFWGEESGLLGSKQFVATPSWPLNKIVANINIEMLGRPEPGANGKIWMTGWQESDLGVIMNNASKTKGVEIFEHPTHSSRLYRSSDNWSFAEKGLIAHSFSGGSLHADYHQPDDEWDRLDIPHMTRVIQGLFVASQPLAQGTVTPQASLRN